MTGIAMVESTYQQFRHFTRYDIAEYWPNEPFGQGGSHVGLMMIDIKNHAKKCFWNWKENAEAGVNFFVSEKISKARQNMKKIQRQNPGLRDLTPVELEKMALVLYRGLPRKAVEPKDRSLQYQYFRVNKSVSPPSWVRNIENNPVGVTYADTVFSSRK